MIDLAAYRREEFPTIGDDGIFLNSASIGPLPVRTVAALATANADRARPATWPLDRLNGILNGARERSARLINAAASEIALMPNTTTGLNIAARALPLKAGDIVLTFDREFPANIYPWMMLAENSVTVERIAPTADGWPDEVRMHQRLLDPRVRAVTVSLTQFSNGYTVDLDALSRATRSADKWLVVDAIQSVGMMPIDVRKTPVDFLACGAQKWLLSPWGTGFLYVRKELCTELMPTFAGWAAFTGSDDYTRLTSYNPVPWPDARRFELLTFPVQDFAGMNSSIDLILEVGVAQIASHIREIHAPVIAAVREAGGRISSPSGKNGSAILCVQPRGDIAAAYARLQELGVSCSLREGAIRLSPHLFNTRDEMERVGEMFGHG